MSKLTIKSIMKLMIALSVVNVALFKLLYGNPISDLGTKTWVMFLAVAHFITILYYYVETEHDISRIINVFVGVLSLACSITIVQISYMYSVIHNVI